MRNVKLLPVCLICFLNMPIAAISAEQQDIEQHRRIQQTAEMHGVHSQKLSDIMRRMIPTLMSEPSDQEGKEQRLKYYKRLTRLSNKVRQTSQSINKFLPNDELDENEAQEFKVLGKQLFEEAKTAQAAAESDDAAALEASLERFNQTCIDCHRLFREK